MIRQSIDIAPRFISYGNEEDMNRFEYKAALYRSEKDYLFISRSVIFPEKAGSLNSKSAYSITPWQISLGSISLHLMGHKNVDRAKCLDSLP